MGRKKKSPDPPNGSGQETPLAGPPDEKMTLGEENLNTDQSAGTTEEATAENKPEDEPQEICKEYLRRYFSPEEREILANQADQAHAELILANEEKASFNANIKSRITNLEGEIARLHRLRQAGFEMDHIKCVITRDYEDKMVRIHRADNGEFVRERRMTLDEQQRPLLPPETEEEVAEHFGAEPSPENTHGEEGEGEGTMPPPPAPEEGAGADPPMGF